MLKLIKHIILGGALILPTLGYTQRIPLKSFFELLSMSEKQSDCNNSTLNTMFLLTKPKIVFSSEKEHIKTETAYAKYLLKENEVSGGILFNFFDSEVVFIYDCLNEKFHLFTFNPIPDNSSEIKLDHLSNIYSFNSNWELQNITSFVGLEIEIVYKVREKEGKLEVSNVRHKRMDISNFTLNQLTKELQLLTQLPTDEDWNEIGCKNYYIKKLCKTCL